MKPPFEVGDLVKLVNGTAPLVVEAVGLSQGVWKASCRYLSNASRKYYPPVLKRASQLELYEHNERTAAMPKLYQTKEETPRFGTYLATNSKGELVLEMKGAGMPEAFKASDIEEVKPYTVRLVSANGASNHYRAVPGSVAKGDVLVVGGSLASVAAIDTKSDATRVLKGARVATEKLPEVEASPSADESDDE